MVAPRIKGTVAWSSVVVMSLPVTLPVDCHWNRDSCSGAAHDQRWGGNSRPRGKAMDEHVSSKVTQQAMLKQPLGSQAGVTIRPD